MTERERQLALATEVMLDAMNQVAEGKDDDELIFPQPFMEALAEACNTTLSREIEPVTAGEWRRRTREAKAALAKGDGP